MERNSEANLSLWKGSFSRICFCKAACKSSRCSSTGCRCRRDIKSSNDVVKLEGSGGKISGKAIKLKQRRSLRGEGREELEFQGKREGETRKNTWTTDRSSQTITRRSVYSRKKPSFPSSTLRNSISKKKNECFPWKSMVTRFFFHNCLFQFLFFFPSSFPFSREIIELTISLTLLLSSNRRQDCFILFYSMKNIFIIL